MTRRQFIRRGLFVTGFGAAGVCLYTWRWEPHWVEFVERPLPIANLPKEWIGKRIVQLTDLHIGPRVDDDYLIETFNRVRRLSPEIVVYTGDFTSYDSDFVARVQSVFPHLPLGRDATFGILGNHDYGPNWAHPEVAEKIAGLARNAGIRILRNEMEEVRGMQVVGLDDIWADRFDAVRGLANVDSAQAALVLSHNPDTADEAVWGSYSGWILAGHTHGGQCKAPFLPPPLLPVKNRRYTAGEFALDGGQRMYINRGLGHLIRVRFNSRPEVTVFHLTQESTT